MFMTIDKIKTLLKKERGEYMYPVEFFEGKIEGYQEHDETRKERFEYYCSGIIGYPHPGPHSAACFFRGIGYITGYKLYNSGISSEEFGELLTSEGYVDGYENGGEKV